MANLGFLHPQLLWGLLTLPLFYMLIKLLPPRPQTVTFPAVGLLKTLQKRMPPPTTPPWWLVLLRLGMVALFIVAMAHPVLKTSKGQTPNTPMAIFVDNGWQAAHNWPLIYAQLQNLLHHAQAEKMQVFVHGTADEFPQGNVLFKPAHEAAQALSGLKVRPWPSHATKVAQAFEKSSTHQHPVQPIWLSSGLSTLQEKQNFIAALEGLGRAKIYIPQKAHLAQTIQNVMPHQGGFKVVVKRPKTLGPQDVSVSLYDLESNFITRQSGQFDAKQTSTTLTLRQERSLKEPGYLKIDGQNHLGAWWGLATMAGLPKVGIIAQEEQDFPLLDNAFYIKKALSQTHAPKPVPLNTTGQGFDVLFLATQPTNPQTLSEWVQNGGVLVTFAHNWLQENQSIAPLLPVKLRPFARQLEGALSWTGALGLKNINPKSPLASLSAMPLPKDVKIKQQFLPAAQANFTEKTWVFLADNTPLVSGEKRGSGWKVLIHVPATATWSNLPASGFFVALLEALTNLSHQQEKTPLEAQFPLSAHKLLMANTQLANPHQSQTLLAANMPISHKAPPGVYGTPTRPYIHQLSPKERALKSMTLKHVQGIETHYYQEVKQQKDLQPVALFAALLLLLVDSLLRLHKIHRHFLKGATLAAAFTVMVVTPFSVFALTPLPEGAQTIQLAWVDTGNPSLNALTKRGLVTLSQVLSNRTTVEPAPPKMLNPETDTLGFYPLIFWPVPPDLGPLTPKGAENLRLYIENGGLLVIDGHTDLGPSQQAVQTILKRILPLPLKAISPNHVLNRSYYLLKSKTPGRHTGTLWLETNHRLSRMFVGAHDWAGAWAHSTEGTSLRPIAGGGEQQRALAFRFGVNLVMYALLGDYKADQTHVDTLLNRMEAR